jgi:hypothetical protein
MAVVRNIMVRAVADFSQLQTAANRAQNTMRGMSDNINSSLRRMDGGVISKLSGALGGIGSQLAAIAGTYIGLTFLKDATNDAITFDARMGTLNERLGASAQGFRQWADTTGKAMGYSKMQIAEYGNTYSNMLYDAATDQQDLAEKTQKLLEVSAIVRSKTGLSQEETSKRIRSAMNMEADGADELGINVRATAVEQSKAFKELSNGVKAYSDLSSGMQKAIMYQYIIDEVTRRYGTTLADNVATKTAVFTASLKDLRLHLGQVALPIWNAVLPALSSMIGYIDRAVQRVGALMRVLFGFKASDTASATNAETTAFKSQASAVDDLTEAQEKLKKAKQGVAGFDQVNQLASNDASGGAGAGAGGAPAGNGPTDPAQSAGMADTAAAKVEAVANRIKSVFERIRGFISDNSSVILSVLAGLGAGITAFLIGMNWEAIVLALTTAFQGLGSAISSISIPVIAVAALVALLVGNLVYLWQTNEGFRNSVTEVWNAIKNFITTVVTDMWTTVKQVWDTYGAGIVKGFGGFMKSIQDIIMLLWNEYIQPILMEGIKRLKSLWDNHLKGLWENIAIFIAKLVSGALEIWNKFLAPLIKWMLKDLAPIFQMVFSDAMDIIGYLLSTVVDVASGLFKALGGIIDFIVGVFTGDWDKAWNGVKDIFSGVFFSLKAIVKEPLNAIIDMINTVINGLNSVKIPDWVPFTGGKNLSLPTIPKLRNGGITNGPTMALIGDNPGGQEVVSPLDKLTGLVSTAVVQALQFTQPRASASNDRDIVLNIDGRQFARIVKPYIDGANANTTVMLNRI